ncbi:hypothetical protein GQ53DRAFT_840164 [Thozetella sp. PMI_491]|nr:hypothetical protein GQ53DRAFT_840164 [Thozetella sp. PMI_491]
MDCNSIDALGNMSGSGQTERKSRMWYFAKPPHSWAGPRWLAKPSMVTQLQRFGNNGQLVETINMSAVGCFASLFLGQFRRCPAHGGQSPRFLWTTDDFTSSENADIKTESSSQVIMGLAVKTTARTYSHDFEWRFCGANMCVTMTRSMNGTHDIFIGSVLAARWKPRRERELIQSLELYLVRDLSVIAQVNRAGLTLSRGFDGLTSNPHRPDNDGVLQEPDEVADSTVAELVTISTGSWLAHEYFRSSA